MQNNGLNSHRQQTNFSDITCKGGSTVNAYNAGGTESKLMSYLRKVKNSMKLFPTNSVTKILLHFGIYYDHYCLYPPDLQDHVRRSILKGNVK